MLKEFANDLKLQREKLKFSLPEISAQTRINEAFLRQLENGDFSFQQEIYIRAFIKEYANAIELDPDEILKDYELAKKGDYTPKFSEEQKIEEQKITEEEKQESDKSEEPKEKPKEESKEESKEEPEKEKTGKTELKDEKKNEPGKETPAEKPKQKKRVRITPDKPPDPDVKTSSRKSDSSPVEDVPPPVKKSLRRIDNGGDKVQPSVLKGIGLFFLAIFILAGLYFMAKAVFFDDESTDGPEIVRQKFDDVVRENERKLLGKRTDEEIRDSIRRAEEEQRLLVEQNLDTMQLTINSIRSGSIVVVTDSLNIEDPEKISFTGNQYGVWKATRSFLITSPNTTAFTVELNGKKIDIKEKNVKNYLISRRDIQDSTKTGTQNQ